MIKNDNHLKMTFYLKQGEDFLCENEVVTALKAGKKLPISATNTDGAISIVYQGQELLGIEYWDEIFWAMFDLIYNYDSFKEKKLSTFFPMQSCWLILHREGDHIKYQFKSAEDKRQIDIKAIIPFDLFTHEFSLVIWRMIKLLNYTLIAS